jgi:hypothetical protein
MWERVKRLLLFSCRTSARIDERDQEWWESISYISAYPNNLIRVSDQMFFAPDKYGATSIHSYGSRGRKSSFEVE